MMEVDWSVGTILQTLRDLKLDQKTLVGVLLPPTMGHG